MNEWLSREVGAMVLSVIMILTIALGIYIFYDLLLHPKKPLKRRLIFYLFLSYMVFLLNTYFFVIHIPPTGVEWVNPQLKPFALLISIISLANSPYSSVNMFEWIMWLLRVIALYFAPLGFFLGWYFKIMRVKSVLVLVVSTAFAIQCTQHLLRCLGLTPWGQFDVEFIILHTIGGLFGYGVYRLVRKLKVTYNERRTRQESG
ncbi:VanZ family protein [Salipaludibacillus sp. LMS25]|uniref:VanZ family protein n=1 Tax=Salipaludibacillus sp. LMS25 TaxID=2924031 RepID=UPI0020D0B98F|nr:VanZ family protein [Salipaludibacillus sp. LMS25]UTR13133.1 VanZ family protein [Salipaludibacillus sp. LMS25]